LVTSTDFSGVNTVNGLYLGGTEKRSSSLSVVQTHSGEAVSYEEVRGMDSWKRDWTCELAGFQL